MHLEPFLVAILGIILGGSILVALVKGEAAGFRRREDAKTFWWLLTCAAGGLGGLLLAIALAE